MKLNYTLKGATGPALVFIHGFLGSHLQWNGVIHSLQQNYRIMLIDLPGHGAQKNNSIAYQISDIAQAIHHIILEHNMDNAHFIGHSMGGYVASNYATLFPSFVKSLVLINSIAGPDSEQRKTERNRSIKLIGKLKNAFISMAITNLFTTIEQIQYRDIIQTMKNQGHNLTEQTIVYAILAMRDRPGSLEVLKRLHLPTTYVYSPDDKIVPAAAVHKEVELLNCQAVSLNAGHMSILTHPTEIASIIDEKTAAIL